MFESMDHNQGMDHSSKGQDADKNRRTHLPIGFLILLALIPACSPASADGVTAVPLPSSSPGAGACVNPLFPVVATAVWNYHVSGSPTGDYDYYTTILNVNVDHFEEDSHFGELSKAAVWQCTPTGLAALSPGGGTSGTIQTPNASFEYTTTGSTGDTLPVRIAAGDTWTQTLSLHGEHTTSGGTVLTSDGTYTSFFTAAGIEEIKTAAGSFRAMRIDVESNWNLKTTVSGVTVPVHLNITSSVWFAPGVGMVKTVTVFEGTTTTVELTSYTIP